MSTCYQLLMVGRITKRNQHQILLLKRKMSIKKMMHGEMMKILLPNRKMRKKQDETRVNDDDAVLDSV